MKLNKKALLSKKLWTLLGGAGFVIVTEVLNVPIDNETYWAIVTLASSYILGQSHVDAKKVQAEGEIVKEEVKK